jgi:FtsP/CotA-like multicopper oxidase with cupredoxin domain
MSDVFIGPRARRVADLRISRRAALAAAAIPLALQGKLHASAQTPVSATPVAQPQPDLPQPVVLKSVDGVMTETLNAKPSIIEMGAARPVTTYSFNDMVPGRTWEVNPGDVMKVDFINDLPPVDPMAPVDMVRPHEWTTTNLHVHGMHVSPEGNGDNVFLEIKPGESFQYEIAVPDNHPAGLFWYHPHKHGGVCQQVRAGMAGAIIVRGDIDEVEEVKAAQEQVLVLQAIELGDDFQLLDPIPHPSTQEAFFPRTQILYTVNGMMNPKITMYPGEVRRWRILNAAEGKFMSITLADHPMNVIAWDGLTLAEPEPNTNLVLAAGNRVEVLIKAGAPGSYDLILTPGSSQHPEIPGIEHGMEMPAEPTTNSELLTRPILTVEVVGSGPEMALPATLPAYDPPIMPIAKTRTLRYTVERGDDNEFFNFGINGVAFDPSHEPYQMKLGTAEEWQLTNDLDSKLPQHAHVLHVHVNPFKVIEINGVTLEKPKWRDTYVLTGLDGDSIRVQMNLDDFTGKFVEHCHVLSHEDLGMMESLEVIP